ncbi:MAG: PhzF family phenazine biosynthesis protein [Rubricoccaceae bacterium]
MTTCIVDAFTDVPFKGNPAGVCLPDAPLESSTMLDIARELGLSETAFVQRAGDAFSIRYFSPKMEIPLCGHATLASAKVVFERFGLSEVCFMTDGGLTLEIRQHDGRIEMAFPVYETHPAQAPPALLEALGIDRIENAAFNEETQILLLEIADARQLGELAPDSEALVRSYEGINGVLVTAPGVDGYDFQSRYFWPWSGTLEDPVTGATHTFLAPYWSERLGKTTMRSFQASERTGAMEVVLTDGGLLIRGEAVIVFEGWLRSPLA